MSTIISNVASGVGYVASFFNPWAYGSSGQLSQASIDKLNQIMLKAIEDLKNDGCKVIKRSSLLVEHVVKLKTNELEASIQFSRADSKSVQITLARRVEQVEMKTLLAKGLEKSFLSEDAYLENFDHQGKADLYTRATVLTVNDDKQQQLKDLKACFSLINKKSEKPSCTLPQASSAPQKNHWVIFKDKSCPTKVLKDELESIEKKISAFTDTQDVKVSFETVVYEMKEQFQNELFKIKQGASSTYELYYKKMAIAADGQLIENLEAIKDKANLTIEPTVSAGKPSYSLYETFVVGKDQFDAQIPKIFNEVQKSINC